ncbi:hypothetical protein PIB30_076189 [Stylosanthes scabra]|uniref:Uncharacterized protein n=1 Tax=Stylosanthes scabra TaxID=79078 RepID=A0ABU6YRZ5_9FABA|nr:hypothetical protein [Stylosanthes scabra]
MEGLKFKSECPTNEFIMGRTWWINSASTICSCGGHPLSIAMHDTILERVVPSPFGVSLPRDNNDVCDLGNNHSFGELAVVMVGTSQPPPP